MAEHKTTSESAKQDVSQGKPDNADDAQRFPVVGIGASAGGLEALEELIDNLPAETGMAFVIVTHQHPGHTSLLPELLGRDTEMPVTQATDGIKLQTNHVYVAPPGEYLSLLNNTLHLIHIEASKAPRLPIDHFFRSLADDLRERSIGIVLSGTGTDGTVGLKKIKAESGMAMVQQPDTAKYAGMPSSAIATGLADYIVPPAAMPAQLIAYARGPFLHPAPIPAPETTVPQEPLQKIFLLLRSHTGHDFSGYKTNTIRRRIQRRMNVHEIDEPNQYVQYLREHQHEIDILFKELLISVTSFFRDPEAWETLASGPLPRLLNSRQENYTVRAWVPGCATGEEVYSLAILLREQMDKSNYIADAQVFGTDLDAAAIETARTGCYADGVSADMAAARLKRYLVHEDGCYRVRSTIREMAVFAPQNVIKDPPFTNLDILCCRNLMIYLANELQQKLLPVFHYALKPGGLLFLGPSETTGTCSDLFEAVDVKWKIFRRKESATVARPIAMPASTLPVETFASEQSPQNPSDPRSHTVEGLLSPRASGTASISGQIERLLLGRFCPISVVVNDRGDIIYVHGRTGPYLETAEGQPRLNVMEMAREGLQFEIGSAIREASASGEEVVRENIRVSTNGDYAEVNVAVSKIITPETLRNLLLVTFRPIPADPAADTESMEQSGLTEPAESQPPPKRRPDRVVQLEREVQFLKETHQSTLEELETSSEELRSTNEELQSTNEEMQSTNEELETSKEELQSLNEELTTVNTELQSKVDELSHANDDMQNLLNSTDVATIFLDSELKVRRFTEQVGELVKLRTVDVGRPIEELAMDLQYNNLTEDCHEVLRTLKHRQQEVVSKKGVWYMMRIMPYRTINNVIDGLVVTFVDINELKAAENSSRLRTYFENLFDTVRQPLIVLDEDLCVISANRFFCQVFQTRSQDIVGKLIFEVGNNEWDVPELRALLEDVLPKNKTIEDLELHGRFRSIGEKVFLVNARRVEQQALLPGMILIAMEDVTGNP